MNTYKLFTNANNTNKHKYHKQKVSEENSNMRVHLHKINNSTNKYRTGLLIRKESY